MTRYFISGHLDLTEAEFQEHYAFAIQKAFHEGGSFVIGDARGADTMAQQFLHQLGCEYVRVFHMFEKPRNNVGNFRTAYGYLSDKERDEQLTKWSDADIAWVRPGRESSGTAKNLGRRSSVQ